MKRRVFLAGTVSGVVGLGAGVVTTKRVEAAAQGPGIDLETANAVDTGSRIARYGTRRVVWSVNVAEPIASISFDDGPDPEFTPAILTALDAAGVKATFNVMGYNAVKHQSLLKEVVAAGHVLGNHTWSHRDLAYASAGETRSEIVRCGAAVEDIVQRPLRSFRPPRGNLNGSGFKICAELGYDVFIWSMTRGPGSSADPKEVASYVSGSIQPGDVVDLHDSIGRGVFDPGAAFAERLRERRATEVKALPEMLLRIADKGIALVPETVLLSKSID